MNASRASRGFTLLEVLIALAIVAMSAGALMGTVTSSGSNISYLRDKTQAEWVALNRLAELRIGQQIPDKGKRTGFSEMCGMRWQWEQEVTELPFKGLWRIDVRARPTGEPVDDSRQVEKPAALKVDEGEAGTSATDKLNWTTTVSGVISSARSDRQTAVAAPFRGQAGNTAGGGGNNPGAKTPGTPGAPGMPGTPGQPGQPRRPGPGVPGGGGESMPSPDR